jgi:DNA-binding NarL/FixJ family response regulator
MSKARILLADDHAMVLEGVKTVLADPFKALAEPFEIVEAVSDGRSLMEAALRLKPDLILLDVSMPLLSGIEAGSRIKAVLPEVKLLFFTMHSERSYLQAAFEARASGYVLKSAGREELLDAIQEVLEGQIYISSGLSDYRGHLRDPHQVAKSLMLSSREREVLQLISEGRSSKEMADILGISVKTVSFHRENIKRKLGVRTTAELTRNAITGGFM